jgi:hypothetical protein
LLKTENVRTTGPEAPSPVVQFVNPDEGKLCRAGVGALVTSAVSISKHGCIMKIMPDAPLIPDVADASAPLVDGR